MVSAGRWVPELRSGGRPLSGYPSVHVPIGAYRVTQASTSSTTGVGGSFRAPGLRRRPTTKTPASVPTVRARRRGGGAALGGRWRCGDRRHRVAGRFGIEHELQLDGWARWRFLGHDLSAGPRILVVRSPGASPRSCWSWAEAARQLASCLELATPPHNPASDRIRLHRSRGRRPVGPRRANARRLRVGRAIGRVRSRRGRRPCLA